MAASVVQSAIGALVGEGARQGLVDRGTRAVRWIEAGAGEPVVVADAGLGEPGSLAWAGVMRELAGTPRVVAYDRAGLGASDPASELSLDQQLDDLAAVAAAVSERPCVLVGHSWGGLLALLAAWRHPHAVCGLVLLDPADERLWLSAPPEVRREQERIVETLVEQHAAGTLAATIRDMSRPYAEVVTADRATRELLLDAYASCYALASQASMPRDELRMTLASIPQIGAIRAAHPPPDVPMVVFSATTGLPEAPRREWTRMHAELAAGAPRAGHVILADTGHAMHQERPAEVAAATARVVREAAAER